VIYEVVEAKSAGQLKVKVQTMIDNGWEPLGGISVATYGAGVRQAPRKGAFYDNPNFR